MNSKAIEEYKARLHLTSRQRELLIGMILGDAHLEKPSMRPVARLKIEHATRQMEYVQWKYSEWREWILTPPRIRNKKNRLGTTSNNVGFTTVSHSELETYRSWFYDGRRKKVPSNLFLSPLSLAVWFMDDGSRKSRECRGLYLNTQAYSPAEIEILQVVLQRDLSVHTTVRRQSDGLQIYVPSDEVPHFVHIVQPYMIATMRYKLPG
jgi:hypothetical protein